jgi:hypothetical protein
MKLCWDNIEDIRLSKSGNFHNIVNGSTYYLKVCKACKEEFLGYKKTKYCSIKCGSSGENNPMYGKYHTEEAKQKISKVHSGKTLSNVHKENISKSNKGRKLKPLSNEAKSKLSTLAKNRIGSNGNNWKGGVTKRKLPLYDTYAPQLEWVEETRRSESNKDLLEVRCFKCGEWFIPSYCSTCNRIQSIKGNNKYRGEFRFYCSKECKHSCSIYGKKPETLMREDAVRAGRLKWLELDREVQAELRQLVLARDGYKCKECGSTEQLHCHHILPVAVEPLLSADIDNCTTLCVDCHKQVHKKDGCRYGQLHIIDC